MILFLEYGESFTMYINIENVIIVYCALLKYQRYMPIIIVAKNVVELLLNLSLAT